MRISFIIPSRNNLKYLKQAVESVLEHYGDEHDLVLLDDASTDGTWDYLQSIKSDTITIYRNEGPDRVGHTVLYDKGVELSKTDAFTIFHADMVTTPFHIPNLLKHLNPKTVVSATRIEPPLHPPGPEKMVMNFGLEPEEFSSNKNRFYQFVNQHVNQNVGKVTQGIFAPWMMYKEDFVSIGGHDKLFAPMELEDSDVFNRMHLAGMKFVQARDSFVYHMTCRGSRYKDGLEIEREIPLPDGTIWYKPKDSEEYTKLRQNKFREWFRKWHCNVLHDELMMPIVPKRYETAFVMKNCNERLLSILEPWCDYAYVDCKYEDYVKSEQRESLLDISNKVRGTENVKDHQLVVSFDCSQLNENLYTEFIQKLPFIVEEAGSVGEFEYSIFNIKVKDLNSIDMVYPNLKNVF